MNAESILFAMLKGGVGKRARDEIGACIARHLRNTPPPALGSKAAATVSQLRKTGFCEIPPIFTAEKIKNIIDYFARHPPIYYNKAAAADGTPKFAGHRFAEWDQATISACPEFAEAVHDPDLALIAEAYLEAPPVISILTAWWSYPSDAPLGGMQHFHHDRDDFRTLKLFVYLTDVTENTGPHQYVDCTHEAARMPAGDQDAVCEMFTWMDASHRKAEADVRRWFNKPRTITGPAGSTFLEDTRGLHRGVPPRTGPRLAFEICYTMLPKHNAKYSPISWHKSDDVTRLFYANERNLSKYTGLSTTIEGLDKA